MTGKYDKILEFTPTWISTNALFLKVGGNKAEFLRKLKEAESDGYIEVKQEGNKKFYKRNDNGDSELGFQSIITMMEWNQNVELDKIKELTTIGHKTLTDEGKELLDHVQDQVDKIKELTTIGHKTLTDEGKELLDHVQDQVDKIKELTTIGHKTLTDEGKELLDHVQDQVDRAYMVIVRMNYQSKLKVINQRTANERTERLQQHIDKTMKALTSKFNNDLIREYFQNHVKNLEFKI